MGKYDYAPERWMRLPVQFGKRSKKRHLVRLLGIITLPDDKENRISNRRVTYYRREDNGRFVVSGVYKQIDHDGTEHVYRYMRYTQHWKLHKRIKQAIIERTVIIDDY